jgi:hypothetical protein
MTKVREACTALVRTEIFWREVRMDMERALTITRVMKRMRRKIEIVRMDRKAQQDAIYHDMNELLSLLDMLERAVVNDNKG